MRTKFLTSAFILSTTILCFLAYYSLNFDASTTYSLVLSGLLIAISNFYLNIFIGVNEKMYGRFVTSFIAFTLIVYLLQFFNDSFFISYIYAFFACFVYSVFLNCICYTKGKLQNA